MEPVSPIELCDSFSLSPLAQRAQLEKVQREISMRESDIALLEANHRQKIAHLDATHREFVALLEAKQRDSEKEQQQLQSALARVVFPVLTLPTEIVSRIFIICRPTDSHLQPSRSTAPLLVAQICRQWREIALETSELWASVYIRPVETRPNPPREFLATQLRRAKGFPLSLCLHSYPALVPSPNALLQTYSSQLRHFSLTLSLTDVLDLQLNFKLQPPSLRKLTIGAIEPLADGVVILEDLSSVLELTLNTNISMANLGIYPMLTSLTISFGSDTSEAELHHMLRTCPYLIELVVERLSGHGDMPFSLTTHPNLESLDTSVCVLDSLVLPNLQKLAAYDVRPEVLIGFLARSSCCLRYFEFWGNRMTDDEWQRFLELLPSLDTLIIDHGDPFFAAASRPLVLPLVRNLKVETCSNFEFPYATFAQFLASRKDAVVPLRSLQLNVKPYRVFLGLAENPAGIGAVFAQGVEMSEGDPRSDYALQWRYGEKFPGARLIFLPHTN
ncbi:hypothetical protein C8J57DRAFT_1530833 [Mycena rebaudengoi]|nr:hypothetical protein C8J57DRAFT_1530833 [Mycena rebaudengoi]